MKNILLVAIISVAFLSLSNLDRYELISSENKAKTDKTTSPKETTMKEKLLAAEKISQQLFEEIEKNNLIVPGKTERQLNEEVSKLAYEKFGIENHWHKKIIRTGKNTMAIYNDNPPDLTIQKDDILFIDYGIIADGWESDFAKTYVLGNDERKLKIKKDVEKAWHETQTWYKKQNHLKANEFFKYIVNKANEYGYTFGGVIAGHIVGKYPHEQPADPKSFDLDVHPDNHNDMFLLDANGNERNWILEMHFVDKKNNMAAYMEKLL
jgi:methionine aminopeptidase